MSVAPDQVDQAVQAWHVHMESPPYCKSWFREESEKRALAYAHEYGLQAEGPYPYRAAECPYRAEMEAQAAAAETTDPLPDDDEEVVSSLPDPDDEEVVSDPAPVPTSMLTWPSPTAAAPPPAPVATPDPAPAPPAPVATPAPKTPKTNGKAAVSPAAPKVDSIDLSTTVCDECGETLDKHSHPSKGGAVVAVAGPIGRVSSPRRNPADREPCPHCGGALHLNDAAFKQNYECLYRQQLVSSGIITNPLIERLPEAGAAELVSLGNWLAPQLAAGSDLRYGKMASATGAVGTYAATKVKAKPLPDPASVASVTAVADDVVTSLPDADDQASTDQAPVSEPVPEAEPDPEAIKAERAAKRRELLKNRK